MENEKIHQLLKELHIELENAENIDEDSQQLLKNISRDVQKLITKEKTDLKKKNDIFESLQAAVEKFEGAHPSLTSTINKIADALSNMGI